MANVSPPDPHEVAKNRGTVVGFVIAIAATLVAYFAVRVPTSTFLTTAAWTLFLGPVVAGLGLLASPKTNRFAAGLLIGVAVMWAVAVPACVVVGIATIPCCG